MLGSEVGHRLQVRTIESGEELFELRQSWESVGSRCSETTIFSTWEWCTTSWKHLGKSCRPLVIVVEDGTDAVGIAPLVIERRRLPLRVARFMGHGFRVGSSVSDYSGFNIVPGRHEGVLKQITDELLRRSGDWDVLDLHEVPGNSCLVTSWLDELDRRGLVYSAERQSTTYPIALPDTWQSYLQGLSTNTRSELERKMRKLTREHHVRVERVEDACLLSDSMNTFFALHGERWKSQNMPGMFYDRRVREFHLEVADRFLEKGWLDLNIVFADNLAIGAIYNFAYRDTTYYYLSGFSPTREWSHYSLGSILIAFSIKNAIDKEMGTFDLLRGNESYKLRFRPRATSTYRLQIARTEAAYRSYSALLKLRGRIRPLVGFLKKLGGR